MGEKRYQTGSGFIGKLLFCFLSGIIGSLLLFLSFVLFYERIHQDKIYIGVTVSGINIGGLTRDEADQRLRQELKYPYEKAFSFTYDKDTWHAIPEELGMQIQFPATLLKAWNIGRAGSPLENLADQISALLFRREIDPVLLFDERVAFNFVTTLAGYIDEPMEQPSLTLHGSEVIITPGKSGKAVDRLMTLTMLHIYGENLQTGAIEIPVTILDVSASNLDSQKGALQSLLNEDFSLFIADDNGQKDVWTVPADMLAGWIEFEPIVNDSVVTIQMSPKREQFYNRLVTIGKDIFQKPQNARFIFNDESRQIEPIKEAVVGREIDIEKTMDNIAQAIRSGLHQAEVALIITQPMVTSSAVGSDLGIIELAESQYTYFYGSDDARVQNIQAASASLHGLLIAPGEVFSMADNIGEISEETGYADASVIFGTETVQGIGGGVCQVSTTLFRTAFFYGLPIVERHAHAYRVFYYERIANATIDPRLSGLDASVYIPVLDLKFTNDTPYWILMENYVLPDQSSIQWKFYSTDVNRYVDWTTSGLINVTEPGEAVYRENRELPSGEIKQVDWQVKGADVSIERSVYQDGMLHLHDKFDTTYEPVRDLFEYGPGTEGMPPEKLEDSQD